MGPITIPLPVQCILSASLGVLSHLYIFIRGEHHLRSPFLFRLYLTLSALLFLSQTIMHPSDMSSAFKTSFFLIASYATSLFTSMTTYRVFFHRLRHFPGPPLAAVSKLYHVLQVLDAKQYLFLDKLRKQYGDYVRTGPNELTIYNPAAVPLIHGSENPCAKADWYDNLKPLHAINTTRSKQLHEKRRRIWDMGFSQKSLDMYEPRVLYQASQLASQFAASAGKPVNATEWFSYFAFDVMSELSFGKPLGMLKSGKSHYVRDLLIKGIMVLGPLTPVPWLFHLFGSLPRMTADWLAYRAWVLVQLKERMQMEKAESSNVMTWLINAGEEDHEKWDSSWLEGDAVSMVVAGSEPEASTLTFLFYHLAQTPSAQEKLHAELESTSFSTDARTLQYLPYLNGCIYEALRLHPPLPSGCLRITPPEGLNVDGIIIPGGVTVLTPAYSLGRLESCFQRPQEFVPERWHERPEMLRDKNAWIPFNVGAFAIHQAISNFVQIYRVVKLTISRALWMCWSEYGVHGVKDCGCPARSQVRYRSCTW